MCYNGSVSSIKTYLDSIGTPMPLYVNPAEFLLDLTTSDFSLGDNGAQSRLEKIHSDWKSSVEASSLSSTLTSNVDICEDRAGFSEPNTHGTLIRISLALLHRSFIKSYRDVVAYGIRFAMYIGLAIMMGTVWLRLSPTQSHIQPFINAIVSPPSKLEATVLIRSLVLWLCIHVIHGRCLRAIFPGGPCHVHQRAC